MAYSFKGTTIINSNVLYSRIDRYSTNPKGSEVAPYFTLKCVRNGSYTGSTSYIYPAYNTAINQVQQALTIGSQPLTRLQNAAYEALRGKVYESMQLAVDVAEGRQTKDMLAKRGKASAKGALRTVVGATNRIVASATTLTNAYRALRRGNLSSCLWWLKTPKKKAHKKLTKKQISQNASSLWLEYWLGWAPLFSTIYNAAGTLTGTIGHGIYKATRSLQESIYGFDPGVTWLRTGLRKTAVRMGAEFTLVNPNAFLREQAGLNNPASVVWALIPFSFLLDWITNMSSCLGSMSDYSGLSIRNAYTTHYGYANARDKMGGPGPATPANAAFNAVEVRRSIGLTGPTLRLTLPRGLSVTRAATSVALLLTVFKS